VSFEGIDDSAISKTLRADARKLVGQRFDQEAVDHLAERLRKEITGYSVDVKVRRAETVDRVRVTFHAEPRRNSLYMQASPLVYHSNEGFNAVLGAAFESHHNYFSANWTSTADELLERNEGYRLRYEHRRVGTGMVHIGVQFDRFHPAFKAPTQAALTISPEVPGAYRIRQDFAPSVAVLPLDGVKFTVGLSLQNLDFDVPGARTARAYAFTADAEVQRKVTGDGGLRHAFGVDYSLRRAATALDSDFVYTRHLVAGDYTLSRHRHLFGVHGRLGTIDGAAPLFERFSLGNSFLLRGWDKFDVAPLGGSRLAYGSLEYRYRPFQIFWDFGSVWDASQTAKVRHSIGIGVASRDTPVGGWFATVAFPVRLNDVGAVVMFGVRR
jgi:outer membrane translocation and assembly module TamA